MGRRRERCFLFEEGLVETAHDADGEGVRPLFGLRTFRIAILSDAKLHFELAVVAVRFFQAGLLESS